MSRNCARSTFRNIIHASSSPLCSILYCALISHVVDKYLESKFPRLISLSFFPLPPRTIPATCSYPVCDNDSKLCPGAMICRDEISSQFNLIDDLCTYLFTMEYGLRLLTCWAVTPRCVLTCPLESCPLTHSNTEQSN